MQTINVLPESVANKIAAGEVVERPASVVKELAENSIDSGARAITVEIAGGGLSMISVSDDGCGMSRGDALLSIERHATSKIRDAGDLSAIGTLGFRGEAIPSIAAVSKFEMLTMDESSDAGTKVKIVGGRLVDVGEEARPAGTTVRVGSLFFNTPARRKFLRSPQTERSHIIRSVVLLALSHPAISFRLMDGGEEVLYSPARDRHKERVADLLGADFAAATLPFEYSRDGITIRGCAGVPEATKSSRRGQYVFVNRRPVFSPVVQRGITKGYSRLLPAGRHPVLLLFVEVGPSTVDVNVHPAKREVKFSKPSIVESVVAEAISRAVRAPAPLLRARERGAPYAAATAGESAPPAEAEDERPRIEEQAEMERGRSIRVLGQLKGLFIVCEAEEGLLVIDQHAAHERVLYEKYLRNYREGPVGVQRLLIPQVIEMGPAEYSVIERHTAGLKAVGYDIEPFGDRSFAVAALPEHISGAEIPALVGDIVEELESGGGGTVCGTEEERIIAASCRAAVKRSDRLDTRQLQGLVDALLLCGQPSSCPHGRPTMWAVGWHELDRSFKR